MLGNSPFYFGLIRKYVVLFGATFDQIYIDKVDKNATDQQKIKVPISYGPKDKLLARVDNDPTGNRGYATLLPRMTFEISGIRYAGERKTPSNNYLARYVDQEGYYKQFAPVPYDISFDLAIAVKNAEDGTKIIEQILPFFTPHHISSVVLIEQTDVRHDIPIILVSIDCDDQYEGDFDTRRSVVWTLRFEMKAMFYGPITKPGIIKFVTSNFYTPNVDDIKSAVGVTDVAERVDVQVAMTANGQPTSNAAQSIDYTLINIDDDYGFATTIYSIDDTKP